VLNVRYVPLADFRLARGDLMSLVTTYLCLAGAILTEVIATTALAASKSLSKPVPSIISVFCFVAAFWLLSFPLRTMPTGIVYAIWSGLGIVLITAVAWVWAKQVLDLPALIGMALITAGVIVINVFSKSEGSATSDTQEQTCSVAKSTSAKCQ
jgi:small multidrug resistance pump